MSCDELGDMKNLLWGPSVKDDVFKRWSQGFVFSEQELSALVQWEGGPCAVIAPVQAFILKSMLKDTSIADKWRKVDPSQCNNLLASALCEIILQAMPLGKPVQMTKLQNVEVNGEVENTSAETLDSDIGHARFHERLQVFSIGNVDELLRFLQDNIESLKSTYGVLLFLYSVLLTRGIEELRRELLDPSEPLIDCNHGYGSQSLINLVLTGRAVGHVWDREQNVGGLTLKGLERQSEVGFLTLLEHLRYCEVGNFYKSPKNPVWVLGSETHLTVLFSTEKALVSPETPSEEAKRIFKSFDPEGNNFIAVKTLPDVLEALGLVTDPAYVQIMRRKLDAENLGIILLGVFMEEFFPLEKRSTPDTFPLFHYNGLPRSCPGGKVAYQEGQAVMLESLVGSSILDSNPMLTCLQTKWPTIEVQWLSGSTPSLN